MDSIWPNNLISPQHQRRRILLTWGSQEILNKLEKGALH